MVVVGGDERMVMVGRMLQKAGHQVKRLDHHSKEEWRKVVSQAEALLFPYPYSQKDRMIPGFEHGGVDAAELLSHAPADSLVMVGMGLEAAKERFEHCLRWRNYGDDVVFLQRNAHISAEAAVYELMHRMHRMLDEMNVLVLGYGMFAKAVVSRLKALGARVWVAARSEKARRAAMEDGAQAVGFERLPCLLPHMHAVLNTVPAIVLNRDQLAYCADTTLLMELASPPYGIDLSVAVELEKNVVVLPGLPGRYAPSSAAAALAKAIDRQIEEASV